MIGCYDLRERAELFTTETKITSVSSILGKMLEDRVLANQEKELLKWAGDMIGEVDWESYVYGNGKFSCMLASEIRPIFYNAFLELKYVPSREFLDKLYKTLKFPEKGNLLNTEELKITNEIFKKISKRIFVYLTRNIGHL